MTLMTIAVASCGQPPPREARPSWRDEAERACLRSGAVRESAYVERAPSIDGPGACGALSPFHVSALNDGKVGLTLPASLAQRGHKAYAATLTCAMVPALESWMSEKVQTAAAAVYGQAVVEMHTLGSYSCRRMNNGTGTSMISEHAFADALDVSGFTLADGREVMVRSGWRGAPEDQEFLRSVFVGSCDIFHTVLGPGSDGHHEDHFHLDLMRHASGHHICRPVIKFSPRSAPALEAPMQPPVAPAQRQQEPEADDPYAFEDTSPSPRGAVAANEPVQASPRAPVMQQPMPAPAMRPQPAYASTVPAPARPAPRPVPSDEGETAPLPVSSKGDRLDRTVIPPRAPVQQPAGPGGTVIAKDGSRLGDAPTPPPRPAYAAALPQRPPYPPEPVARPAYASPPQPQPRPAYASDPRPRPAYDPGAPRPPGLLPAPARPLPPPATPARPASTALPPGWSVGAQPVTRGAPAPEPADDPDE
jgi:hypothetical protein